MSCCHDVFKCFVCHFTHSEKKRELVAKHDSWYVRKFIRVSNSRLGAVDQSLLPTVHFTANDAWRSWNFGPNLKWVVLLKCANIVQCICGIIQCHLMVERTALTLCKYSHYIWVKRTRTTSLRSVSLRYVYVFHVNSCACLCPVHCQIVKEELVMLHCVCHSNN